MGPALQLRYFTLDKYTAITACLSRADVVEVSGCEQWERYFCRLKYNAATGSMTWGHNFLVYSSTPPTCICFESRLVVALPVKDGRAIVVKQA